MKRQKDRDEDVPFDVEPVAPTPVAEPSQAPKDLLSASKVEAVRFHPAKPGYAYDQVETFVDAVIRTLRYLEQRMYQDDLAIHEAEQENEILNDQIATLKATIEVFRANGDPVGSSDGGFATASTVDVSSLRAERDSLAAALAASQAEVADLRKYIDEQLAPWLEEQAHAEASEVQDSPEEVVASESPVVAAAAPEDEVKPVVSAQADESDPDEKAIFAATAAAFAAQANSDDDSDDELADDWASADLDGWPDPEPVAVQPNEQPVGLQFSTPEIEALGVEIDPAKIIPTNDSQYDRAIPPKAGTPLPRLLPPEIAAMMEMDEQED